MKRSQQNQLVLAQMRTNRILETLKSDYVPDPFALLVESLAEAIDDAGNQAKILEERGEEKLAADLRIKIARWQRAIAFNR